MRKLKHHLDKAIQYVRDEHTWSEAREALALETIELYRCDIDFADKGIADEINDLMEEYGEDNELSEGWWMEYGDIDDIFFKL